jgi:hypothetical protein
MSVRNDNHTRAATLLLLVCKLEGGGPAGGGGAVRSAPWPCRACVPLTGLRPHPTPQLPTVSNADP